MYSHAVLIGEIIAEPKNKGAAVTLRLRTWRDDGDGNRRDTVHFVEVFRDYRSFALSLRIGDIVLAEGAYETSEYTGKNGRQFFTSMKTIRVQRFVGSGSGSGLDRGGNGSGPPTRDIKSKPEQSGAVGAPEAARATRYMAGRKPPKVQESTNQPEEDSGVAASFPIPW